MTDKSDTSRRPPSAAPPQSPAFDPLALFRALAEHNVRYLVIGGVAATLYGSPALTGDLDICYDRDRPNLEALVTALRALHAKLRGVDPDLPFQLDAKSLENGDGFTFTTDAGDFDCLGTPPGTSGYRDLVKQATHYDVGGIRVPVVSLDDLIRMKQAAGRPKDRLGLEILGALRDQIDEE